jgi:pimeloyl-ACP methyl ester carboxylesterase
LIDLPGYGQSAADGDAHTNFPDFSATAQALLDALPEQVTLCGWSLGGLLAMRAALLAPERVSGLVLVGSTPSFMQRATGRQHKRRHSSNGFSASVEAQPQQTLQRFVTAPQPGRRQGASNHPYAPRRSAKSAPARQ